MRIFLMAAALSVLSPAVQAQGFGPLGDVVSYLGFTAPAPLLPLGPPASGTPVDFIACPERTAGGSWVATDRNGYLFSLAGARVAPNRVVRVTGVVAPNLAWPVPGWPLTPIRVAPGPQPCLSIGVIQPVVGGFDPLFGIEPLTGAIPR